MRIALPLLAASLMGCSQSPITAPYESDISFQTTTYSTEVGLGCDLAREPDYNGYLLINEIMVVNPDGLPLERIEVSVRTDAPAGVYVLPQEAVKTVDFPAADEEVTSEADVKEACVDENGNFDNTNEWCAWYWDEANSQFYQFPVTSFAFLKRNFGFLAFGNILCNG